MRIEKQAKARRDLVLCVTHLEIHARHSVAEDFADSLEESFAYLAEYPEAAPILPTTRARIAGLRHWPVKNFPKYRIFYMVQRDKIVIIRIGHSAQDWWGILGITS
jgi:toxin ParE1/3/4